jgi:hypothetical protein
MLNNGILDITNVDDFVKLKSILSGRATTAQTIPNLGQHKFPKLSIDPSLTSPSGQANTVGHELLHVADMLTDPQVVKKYEFFNTLPGGYNTNSMEVRARLMGDMFSEALARHKAGGPRRVSKVPNERSLEQLGGIIDDYGPDWMKVVQRLASPHGLGRKIP